MRSYLLCIALIIAFLLPMEAQIDIQYQTPPREIQELVDAPLTPLVSVSPSKTHMAMFERPGHPPIEEVAQEELRLAGLRINPKTNGSSRARYYTGIQVQEMGASSARPVSGFPEKARLENIDWSPDGSRIALTHTTDQGLELWVINVAEATARKVLGDAYLSDAMGGSPFEWMNDSRQLLVRTIPAGRGALPAKSDVPAGPIVQSNEGKVAPARTYQDLLTNNHDEAVFEFYTGSELHLLDLTDGSTTPFAEPGLIRSFESSPSGQYVLITYVHRPFSYLVPYYRFPLRTVIYDRQGRLVREVADTPLAEDVPIGFGAVPKGPRSFNWRSDAPAQLWWVEALDSGDPDLEVDFRDQLFYLDAPFEGDKQEGPKVALRYAGNYWGDNDLAIVVERWWPDRRIIASQWSPAQPSAEKSTLYDRSWEDRYNDPGSFLSITNEHGHYVLLQDAAGKYLYLSGEGASPEGNRPFLDRYEIASGETERLWRSEGPYYEYPVSVIDLDEKQVVTRRESRDTPPNYFLRNWETGDLEQLTSFPNPYEAMKGVQKELVRYERSDGVEMTGTLYLPKGFQPGSDDPLPVLMWAYPREYKSADAAGQVSDSPHEFIRLYYGSPIYWVTRGYAVFDDVSMPVIGEGDAEPNETFVEQLRMNAKAAIDKLADMGVGDPNRVGVGGHSYGAFMTANLLAHTDLFAAGIARSGAYNRTLTPYGFQAEERTFWEAPEIYFNMSPFMHAHKIKAPILLIHGEADNNSGTYPMQSRRFYAALKGQGATTRLVMLPHESHGYRARESVMHMLWEMDTWLEKHVKNRSEVGLRP